MKALETISEKCKFSMFPIIIKHSGGDDPIDISIFDIVSIDKSEQYSDIDNRYRV